MYINVFYSLCVSGRGDPRHHKRTVLLFIYVQKQAMGYGSLCFVKAF
jgi:hypothetical protein